MRVRVRSFSTDRLYCSISVADWNACGRMWPDRCTELAATLDEVLAAGLLRELDAELSARYPDAPIHGIDGFQFSLANGYFVVAHICDEAVGCGAFRPLDTGDKENVRASCISR